MDPLNKLVLGKTYCCKLVSDILDKMKQTDNVKFMKRDVDSLYASGAQLALERDPEDQKVTFFLSIQTNPIYCGDAFCETALLKNGVIYTDSSIGYDDSVVRHDSPQEFEEHLVSLLSKIHKNN